MLNFGPGRLCTVMLFFAVLAVLPGCRSEKGDTPEVLKTGEQAVEKAQTPPALDPAYEEVLRELQKNPDNVREINRLADLYYKDGKYEEAVENYRKALSLAPDQGSGYMRLGASLNRLQRNEEAIEAYKQAIPRLSDPSLAYNNMASVYGALGSYQEQIEALRNSIQHRPGYAAAHFNLGVTLLKVGDMEGAKKECEALNELNPAMAEALLKRINNQATSQG